MAEHPVFAKAFDGHFTGLDESNEWRIKVAQAAVRRAFIVQDVTSSGDGREAHFGASKRLIYSVEGMGWYQTESDSVHSFVHLSDNMASLTGGLFGRSSAVVLERRMPLIDVTAAEDAVPRTLFAGGQVAYVGSLRSFLESNETDVLSGDPNHPEKGEITIPLGVGVVTADYVVDQSTAQPSFREGGPPQIEFGFRLTGNITATDTPFEALEFSASLDLDNGEVMTGLVKLEALRVHLNYARVGKIPFEFRGNFSGAVDFASD